MCDTATDSRNLCLKMIHLLINFYILFKSNPPPSLAMLPVRVLSLQSTLDSSYKQYM